MFCADLKTVYQAPTEEKALEALERVTEKWSKKYPNSMRSWIAVECMFMKQLVGWRFQRTISPPYLKFFPWVLFLVIF